MKKIIAFISLGAAFASAASAQSIVAFWSQNSNNLTPSGFGFTPDSFPQSPDEGSGSITLSNFDTSTTNNGSVDVYTYIASFAGTTVNALPNYASGGSLSPQVGSDDGGGIFSNNGMNIDFSVNTVGLSEISISWAQRGTASGFTSRAFAYSSNGGTDFTEFANDSGALGSWTTTAYDLSSVSALDDNASVVFRITLDGGTGSTGNNRFDNILVTAAIPEPSTYATMLGLLTLGFVAYRRRKA